MASNSILSSHDLHTYYHDAKKYQPSHRRAETAPASSSLTRPAGPLVSSRDAALQKRKLHDERTAGESHLPEPGLRPEHQTPPPRAPLPAAQHSPPKRPELSIGPGKRPGSPAPNISQLSKPTYFFHCLNQRLSTRYLQHTAPAGAAPLSGGPARSHRPRRPEGEGDGGREGRPATLTRTPPAGGPWPAAAPARPAAPSRPAAPRRLQPPPCRCASPVAGGCRPACACALGQPAALAPPRPARAASDGLGGAARGAGGGRLAARGLWRRPPSCNRGSRVRCGPPLCPGMRALGGRSPWGCWGGQGICRPPPRASSAGGAASRQGWKLRGCREASSPRGVGLVPEMASWPRGSPEEASSKTCGGGVCCGLRGFSVTCSIFCGD